MLMAMHKKLLWIIVIWFAVLQTVTPFIHGHIEADSPAQGHGLHMHDPALMPIPDDQGQHLLTAHPAHTVGVNAAVVEDPQPLPLFLLVLLFVLNLPVIAMRLFGIHFSQPPFLKRSLRSISRPRAPPLL